MLSLQQEHHIVSGRSYPCSPSCEVAVIWLVEVMKNPGKQ